MKHSFLRHLLAIAGSLVCAASSLSAQEPAASPPPPAKPDSNQQQQAVSAHLKNIAQDNQMITDVIKASQTTSEIAVLAPFAFPVLIVAIVAYTRYRRAQSLHETLRLMVEKGVTIPPELLIPPKSPANDFRRGVLLVGFGAGLMALLAIIGHRGLWSVGLVPLLLGVGYLVVAKLGTKPPAGPGPSLPA